MSCTKCNNFNYPICYCQQNSSIDSSSGFITVTNVDEVGKLKTELKALAKQVANYKDQIHDLRETLDVVMKGMRKAHNSAQACNFSEVVNVLNDLCEMLKEDFGIKMYDLNIIEPTIGDVIKVSGKWHVYDNGSWRTLTKDELEELA